MTDRFKISRAIIVEGKYDKIKLSGIVEGLIIPTNGFSVFKDKSLLGLIRKAVEEKGLIVLTDSDSAGMAIRSYLKKTIGTDNIINVYLPKISGKEKRKDKLSAEGVLGVEGVDDDIIRNALLNAVPAETKTDAGITKLDLYRLGISGGENSSAKRADFERFIGLPDNLSANYLVEYLNFAYTRSQFEEVVSKWEKDQI